MRQRSNNNNKKNKNNANRSKASAKVVVETHRENMSNNINNLLCKAAHGFSIIANLYLGLIYLLLPNQLINVNKLSEKHVPLAIRPWILLLIRLLGLVYTSLAGCTYMIGPNRVYFYLFAAVMNAVVIFLYVDAMLQLKSDIFPVKNVGLQVGLAGFQIIFDLLSFIAYPRNNH